MTVGIVIALVLAFIAFKFVKGIIIATIIAILLLGLVFKLIKLAIIAAIVVGIAMFALKKLGGGGDKLIK